MGFPETYDKQISRYAYPLLLIVCGAVFYFRLPQHMDILFSDEGNYLIIARNMFEKVEMNFGPLYSLWLKFLGVFLSDPIRLYYFNYGFLGVAFPLLIYFFLRRFSFSDATAFFVSLSFLYSAANVTTWPRVSHFALLLLTGGVLLAFRAKTRAAFFQVMALTLLIVSYARAEFLSLSFVFLLIALYYSWKERRSANKVLAGVLFLTFVLILFLFKTPENNYESSGNYTRSFTAFIQHYYLGLTFEGKQFDYWWLSIKDFYYHGEFKDCEGSLFRFIQLHPAQFLHHIFFDIKMYALQVFSKLALNSNPIFNKPVPKHFLLSLLLFAASGFLLVTHRPARAHVSQLLRRHRWCILLLFVLLLPSLAACIIILPRDHYVFLQAPFFILLPAIFAEVFFYRIPALRFGLIPLAVFCLAWQQPGKFSFIKAGPKAGTHDNVKLVHFLRESLPDTQTYRIFSDNIFMSGLLPERFTEPTLMEYSFEFKNFRDFLAEKQINLILVTPETHREPYLRRDSTWNTFLKDPESIEFERIPMGSIDSTYQLYLKQD